MRGRRFGPVVIGPAIIGVVIGAVVLAACGSSSSTGRGEGGTTITVSAAASLGGAFSEIADEFELTHQEVSIRLNVGSSAQLVAQIEQGAPADVVATADEDTMARLVSAGEVAATPQIFAENTLAIVTRSGNPNEIDSLTDLADVATLALCVTAAPCGRYADAALDRAGVSVPAGRITRGADARITLAAVTQNDADAAIVYVTDAQVAGDLISTVSIPAPDNEIARYPIAILDRSDHQEAARALVAFVGGPVGQSILAQHGFLVS